MVTLFIGPDKPMKPHKNYYDIKIDYDQEVEVEITPALDTDVGKRYLEEFGVKPLAEEIDSDH
jgi:hypothetical protein